LQVYLADQIHKHLLRFPLDYLIPVHLASIKLTEICRFW